MKMKNAETLKSRLGAHMAESMGDPSAAGSVLPQGFAATTGQYDGCTRIKDALAIDIGRIVPDPDQPRKEFDAEALRDLADSLKDRGQLQPARVRWDAELNKWVIIAGERRYRAAILAGLPTLACVESRTNLDADEILTDQLVENCLREDLKPIEQAHAYKTLMDRRDWSYSQLAGCLRISKGTVSKALALLKLPEPVQDLVEQGALAPFAAYEVSRLDDPAEQLALAEEIVAAKLTGEDAAATVKARKAPAEPSKEKDATLKAVPRAKPIHVDVQPGIHIIVMGVTSEIDALEALRLAAANLKRRLRGSAA